MKIIINKKQKGIRTNHRLLKDSKATFMCSVLNSAANRAAFINLPSWA